MYDSDQFWFMEEEIITVCLEVGRAFIYLEC